MGCGISSQETSGEMSKSVKAMKAALLIQGWYRRYRAKLEARRRYTWSIFQSLEYAGEQDQLRLYNFFNDMTSLIQLQQSSTSGGGEDGGGGGGGGGDAGGGGLGPRRGDPKGPSPAPSNSVLAILSATSRPSSALHGFVEEDEDLMRLTNPRLVDLPSTYTGPHLSFPLTTNQLECLINAFKRKQMLHTRYLLELLHETRKVLKHLPNVNHASTHMAKQVTICGDLHGKLDDLFIILYKNGLPEPGNPYVFNGDFVDRGPNSIEVAVLLFSFLLTHPTAVCINRGNHEDHVMNLRYGFIKEIMMKYKGHATKVVRLFEEVFSWLPLATIIDHKVLVCHGGISDRTDLTYLASIDRHKYLSALRPPVLEEDDVEIGGDADNEERINLHEWRQILDILWSDPKPQLGCHPNSFRGGGSYFGPDVTAKMLRKHKLKLLVRSHECKQEGYEFDHNNKVLTIFSASNYYETGSNKGAFVHIRPDLSPHIVQYMASKHSGRKFTYKQRVNYVEDKAIRDLKEKICSCKTVLVDEFQKYDPANMGLMKVVDWCQTMFEVLQMDLPWRSLRPKLARCSDNGLVEYHSTFEEYKIETKYNKDNSMFAETLYRNKENLETIFRAIDKDNSGYISMEEFEEACMLLSQHTHTSLSKDNVLNMAKSMDMNKDGLIDFNEFLEAFRIVDQFGRELTRRMSEELELKSDADENEPRSPGVISMNSVTWSPRKLQLDGSQYPSDPNRTDVGGKDDPH